MSDFSPLKELAELAMGETITAADCDGLGYPIYSADTGDAPWNWSSKIRRLNSFGTIVVGARGSIGFPRFPKCDAFGATQTTITVTPNRNRITPEYLYYVLSRLDCKSISAQQAVPMLTVSELSGVQIRNLPIHEQVHIAEILNTLDTAIHETEAIIAKLKAVKQGLLHDLLTRGIDANGELRPLPTEAPHLYKPSPLGWIPKEWGTPTFAELQSQPILGLAVRGAATDGRNVGLVKMGNLCENNELDLTSVEGLAISRVKNIDKFLLEDGDLLFNTRNTPELVGKTCSWHGTLEPYVFDNNILRARIPRRIGSGHYFAHYLGSEIGRRSLLRLATGTTSVAAIYWKDLGSLKVPAPPTAEQAAIHEMIKSVEVKRSFVERGLQILRQMKAGLMDDLLTGRVRVTPLLQEAQQA